MYDLEHPSMEDLQDEGISGDAHRKILEGCKTFLGPEGVKLVSEWMQGMNDDAWAEEGTRRDLSLSMLMNMIESTIRLIPIQSDSPEGLGATGVQLRLILRGVQAALAYGNHEVFRLSYVVAQYLDCLRHELETIKHKNEEETINEEE